MPSTSPIPSRHATIGLALLVALAAVPTALADPTPPPAGPGAAPADGETDGASVALTLSVSPCASVPCPPPPDCGSVCATPDPCDAVDCDVTPDPCDHIPCPLPDPCGGGLCQVPDCQDLGCPSVHDLTTTVCRPIGCPWHVAIGGVPDLGGCPQDACGACDGDIPEGCREPCSYANACDYKDVLEESLSDWSPTRDGVPNPTLDCATGPTIPWVDTDGDGTIDPLDDDDDCDHISDELESHLGLRRLNKDSDNDGLDEVQDMTPDTDAPVAVRVRIDELDQVEQLDLPSPHPTAHEWGDPYLVEGDTAVRLAKGAEDRKWPMTFEKLQKTDHVHNEKIIDYEGINDGMPEDTAVGLPDDLQTWAFEGQGEDPTKFKVYVKFPLRDHDHEDDSSQSGLGDPVNIGGHLISGGIPDLEDDPYGSQLKSSWMLMKIAYGTTQTEPATGIGTTAFTVDMGDPVDATFKVRIGNNLAKCVLLTLNSWHNDGTNGKDYVSMDDLVREYSPSQLADACNM